MGHIILPGRRNWKLNAKPVLLIHGDGADESTTIKDSGGTGHTITANGTAEIDTAQSKWGGSSILFDGDSDYLSIPNHADWDISTNWTTDLWVKHTDHVGTEYYITQEEDIDNFWGFLHVHGQGLRFEIVGGGATKVLLYGGQIADTNWHHIVLCKVGNEYGIYKGGTQVAHASDADMDTFTASLLVGAGIGAASLYFDGHIDEIRIVQGNPFGAAPVVGLTDTIIVPTKPYISWR